MNLFAQSDIHHALDFVQDQSGNMGNVLKGILKRDDHSMSSFAEQNKSSEVSYSCDDFSAVKRVFFVSNFKF